MSIFGSNNKKSGDDNKKQPSEGNLSIISAGTVIDGDLFSEGDIRIEGTINGTVNCRSRIVVGMMGVINGNVDAANAAVAGKINGSVVVRKAIQLQESGKINGDILTESITIMAGGMFTGNIQMGEEAVGKIAKMPQPTQKGGNKSLPSAAHVAEVVGKATPFDTAKNDVGKAGSHATAAKV